MSKFIMKEDFLEVFPEAKIGIVLARGLDNTGESCEAIKARLKEANGACKRYLTEEEFIKNPSVFVWRQAYQKFKTKKGARCSIEAMLKRIHGGNEIRSINPLVDIYNTVSLNYALPCGGEDLDTFRGDLCLTKAVGTEYFVPLGSEENDPPFPQELIYKDEGGAVCRCWNWRESKRTMLTESTKNAFLILEYMDESRLSEFKEALEELAVATEKYLGGEAKTYLCGRDCPEIELK